MVIQHLAYTLKSASFPTSSLVPGLGVDMISKMLKMQMLEDEDDLAYAETEKKARTDSTSDGRPAWMRTLHTTASNWLHLIPQTLSPLKRTVENIKVAGLGSACWSPALNCLRARGKGIHQARAQKALLLLPGVPCLCTDSHP